VKLKEMINREAVKLKEIIKIVEGSVLTKQANLELEILFCGASDLMSDVLAYVKAGSLLLTGLVNPQAIRTAEMADIAAIVFVRGKTPGAEAVGLADELGIPLIASPYSMYEICGRLYQAGIPPVME
jgi:predicted transcriptional regulator